MNNFNRLLLLYIVLFIEKYYMIIIKKMLKILCFEKNAYICNTEKPIKITIMKRNYRIRIFTTEGVIERKFYKGNIAISTIKEFKEKYNNFMIGILSKKVNGEWIPVYSINNNCQKNGKNRIIHYI